MGPAHGCQEVGITVEPDLVGHDDLGRIGHRHGGPTGPAGVVDHLAVGDHGQPRRLSAWRRSRLACSAEITVSWKQSAPSAGADRRRQEAVEVGGVLVEQRLEGWQRHHRVNAGHEGSVRSAAANARIRRRAPSAAWSACPSMIFVPRQVAVLVDEERSG